MLPFNRFEVGLKGNDKCVQVLFYLPPKYKITPTTKLCLLKFMQLCLYKNGIKVSWPLTVGARSYEIACQISVSTYLEYWRLDNIITLNQNHWITPI